MALFRCGTCHAVYDDYNPIDDLLHMQTWIDQDLTGSRAHFTIKE